MLSIAGGAFGKKNTPTHRQKMSQQLQMIPHNPSATQKPTRLHVSQPSLSLVRHFLAKGTG